MTTGAATPREPVARAYLTRGDGATNGIVLVLLGLWVGLVPFIGPYFNYAYSPDSTWLFTWTRFLLEILPAAAMLLGGAMLLSGANLSMKNAGGWLAAIGAVWLLVGPSLSRLWTLRADPATVPTGQSPLTRGVQEIGFFYGAGAFALLLAALALGRFSTRKAGGSDTVRTDTTDLRQ